MIRNDGESHPVTNRAVRRPGREFNGVPSSPQVGAGAPHEEGLGGEHSTIVVRIGGMDEHIRWVDQRVADLKRGRGRCT